ncbi:MAG TPA: 30S ribosomal protein S20 [Firmicutes bacterium]|jgi:small subunit ribosomal protein S20|nr:30S ribosomal protein S20 [Bacillota bacterium]
MANIKSSKKRILVSERNFNRNRAIRSSMRSSIKKFQLAVAEGNKEEAQKLLSNAFSSIDKAAKKGVIHRNQANRRKARLHKSLSTM